MNTFDIFLALQQLAPVNRTDTFWVAVSGGVDSVVLAALCKKANLTLRLAHCNFQLRGDESDRDEAFVRTLAADWNLPVHVNKVDLNAYATAHHLSVQEAARKFRYDWFETLASSASGNNWVLTAHHADDNIETLAMHFFRGTGLAGLTGIPPRNGRLMRPLLSLSRAQVLALAQELQLSFVEDSSNASDKYTRNYFRNTLLPAIEKVYPSVKKNLAENIERFSSTAHLYRQALRPLLQSLLVKKGDYFQVRIASLQRYQNKTLLFELFHPFGFSQGQLAPIEQLLTAATGAQLQATDQPYRLIKHRHWLLLCPIKTTHSAFLWIERDDKQVHFEQGQLSLSVMPAEGATIDSLADHAWLDLRCVQFPLLLRPVKQGDYFYPLGMRKKKKLSRFFIDQKFSLPEKENCWVLESQGKIIWVVGRRIDDRVKVTPSSRHILRLAFTPAAEN